MDIRTRDNKGKFSSRLFTNLLACRECMTGARNFQEFAETIDYPAFVQFTNKELRFRSRPTNIFASISHGICLLLSQGNLKENKTAFVKMNRLSNNETINLIYHLACSSNKRFCNRSFSRKKLMALIPFFFLSLYLIMDSVAFYCCCCSSCNCRCYLYVAFTILYRRF